jgi:hypothetical protein
VPPLPSFPRFPRLLVSDERIEKRMCFGTYCRRTSPSSDSVQLNCTIFVVRGKSCTSPGASSRVQTYASSCINDDDEEAEKEKEEK